MPISFTHKVIFLHIPKTGGTSIEALLEIKSSPENLFWQGYRADVLAPQHLTYAELKAKIKPEIFNEYFKFAFVRNPWERLVSTYFWNNRGHKTFESFVHFLDKLFTEYHTDLEPPAAANGTTQRADGKKSLFTFPHFRDHFAAHYLPQHLYIGPDVTVYRFENFAEENRKICQQLEIKERQIHHNPTRHQHYSTYYTEETKQIVARIYAVDIELFGYQFESK